MARILIGWENGGGFGHVARARMAARVLKSRGHEVVFAIKDLIEPWPMVRDEGYPVIPAPYYARETPARFRPFSAATFADILAVSGFFHANELSPVLRGWDGLFEMLRPDLVLAEYAPIMVLAAYGRYPTVMFGSGFTVPPADLAEFPRLQPKVKVTMPEAEVLAVVQEAQRRRKARVPERLGEIFDCGYRYPCTFPELDPYRGVRKEPVIPPVGDLPPPLPPSDAPRFFTYLAGDSTGLEKIIKGLVKSRMEGAVYVRGMPPKIRELMKGANIHIFDEPQPLTKILPLVSVVIHHGGAGTTEACLTAGRAQIISSRHLEQSLTAKAVEDIGCGSWLSVKATEDGVANLVRGAGTDPKMRERVAARAQEIAGRGPRPGIMPVVAACEAALARPRAAGA